MVIESKTAALRELTRRAFQYFAYKDLEYGYYMYLNDDIEHWEEQDGYSYGIFVDPDEDEEVRAELMHDAFQHSTCTCRRSYSCEHLAALMFFRSAKQGLNVFQLITPGGAAWVRGQAGGASGLASLDGGLGGSIEDRGAGMQQVQPDSRKGKQSAQSVGRAVEPPKMTDSVTAWHTYFSATIRPMMFDQLPTLATMHQTVNERLMPVADGWSSKLRRAFYEIHIQLFIMKLLGEIVTANYRHQYSYDYYRWSECYRVIAVQSFNQLVDVVSSYTAGDIIEKPPAELLRETAAYVAEHAFPEQSAISLWNHTYTQLWWTLLWEEELVEIERARLRRALREDSLSMYRHDRLLLAMTVLDIRAENDDAARSRIEKMKNISFVEFAPYFQGFADMEQWSRLVDWLKWFTPYVQFARGDVLEDYFETWESVLPYAAVEQSMQEAIVALLPRSMPYYSGYLLGRGKYMEWVDVHMALGFTPLDFRVSELKDMENESRELLLPWYHLSAEQFIAEKNRDAYKQAVKLLKRLETMYKKLKRTEEWDRYLAHIVKKYSRLRALQEELGKLKKGVEA
ncbi:hypothetical protein [Paenibacillus sp. YYML68]|uniref:hypothetical protein n=1 Tax=Paenibacillus sp. YYML68 TaxID=2909250 RepID=UPI0024909F6A|nr:hypothetical protein [Paenibacillus sp. YYML68]